MISRPIGTRVRQHNDSECPQHGSCLVGRPICSLHSRACKRARPRSAAEGRLRCLARHGLYPLRYICAFWMPKDESYGGLTRTAPLLSYEVERRPRLSRISEICVNSSLVPFRFVDSLLEYQIEVAGGLS